VSLGPLPPANADLAVAGKPSFAYAQYLKSLDAAVRNPAVATASVAGVVKPDGTTITVAADGTITAVDTDVVLTSVTNSLTGDVALNNGGSYFDGPSVAQGSTGTWFASGTVSVLDTAGASNFNLKLWDGTTVIASARATTGGASFVSAISLSGILASPAGNLRISVNDPGGATGKILFNTSGNSKDSTLTAVRIA
jgi:hypothetical protein